MRGGVIAVTEMGRLTGFRQNTIVDDPHSFEGTTVLFDSFFIGASILPSFYHSPLGYRAYILRAENTEANQN